MKLVTRILVVINSVGYPKRKNETRRNEGKKRKQLTYFHDSGFVWALLLKLVRVRVLVVVLALFLVFPGSCDQ